MISLLSRPEPLFPGVDELRQRGPQRLADRPQLNDVQPAVSPFHLADERLALPEPLGQFHLRDAALLSQGCQLLQQEAVFIGVDGLFHNPP